MNGLSQSASAPLTADQLLGLDDSHLDTLPDGHRLQGAAANAFAALCEDARKAGFDPAIASSYRSFDRQLAIFNAKVSGARTVHDDDGAIVAMEALTPVQQLHAILRFSALPGTSRHHWGTDFDINSLNPAYYRNGTGKVIYDWMLANAPDFGFCLVYTEDRDGGYQWEPWHWSFRPLSSSMLRDWNELYEAKKIRTSFAGSDSAFHLAPEYVNTIGAACK